jgi:carboxymethylenebutenolidase
VWDPFKGRSSDNSTREELSALLRELDDDAALAEQAELLDHLTDELGCTKVGVMGWCLGGRFALLLGARDQRPVNVIAFHPTVPSELAPQHTYDAIAEAGAITAPVLVSYPSADSLVSNADFEALEASLQTRTSGATFTQYFPGAEHGFTDRSRQEKQVNADAYRLAWPQALAFIRATTAGH